MKHLTLDPEHVLPPTRDLPAGRNVKPALPDAKETKVHPRGNPTGGGGGGGENARLMFVGTATTVLYVLWFNFLVPGLIFKK